MKLSGELLDVCTLIRVDFMGSEGLLHTFYLRIIITYGDYKTQKIIRRCKPNGIFPHFY